MVSVGVVGAYIGGKAVWTVPASFVAAMALGSWLGAVGIGSGSTVVELAIALSVILPAAVILLDRRLRVPLVMAAVAFVGFFDGYSRGQEIPEIAGPIVDAIGFLVGTVLIPLLGVLIGDIAKRYPKGSPVLRTGGGVFVLRGSLFIVGAL